MKKTKIKNTGEYVYTEKLKNGLEVIMIPNNKVKNFYLTLNVKFGSIHTNFKFEGNKPNASISLASGFTSLGILFLKCSIS